MRALLIAILMVAVSTAGCVERHTFQRCLVEQSEFNEDGSGTLCHDARLRTFLHFIPEGDGPFPLLVALHGGGGDAENLRHKTHLDEWAINKSFVLIIPEGTPTLRGTDVRTWNATHCCEAARNQGTDDVGFLNKLIRETMGQVMIDENRIGVTGHSNGGMMAHTYGAWSDIPTHIMPVAGSIGGRSPAGAPLEVIPIPKHDPPKVFILHADDDARVPYYGGEGRNFGLQRYDLGVPDAIKFWTDAGAHVEHYLVNGGHGWPGGEADVSKAPSEPDASALIVDFLFTR